MDFVWDYPGENVLEGKNRKVKPIWIYRRQETVSGSGTSWAICICTSPQTDNHARITPLSFLQACPSCRPTNSVKALRAQTLKALRILTIASIQLPNSLWQRANLIQQSTVNTAYMCVHIISLCTTARCIIRHRTVLTIFILAYKQSSLLKCCLADKE